MQSIYWTLGFLLLNFKVKLSLETYGSVNALIRFTDYYLIHVVRGEKSHQKSFRNLLLKLFDPKITDVVTFPSYYK